MNNNFDELVIRPIAHIKTDFKEKFGIPRQSRLVPELKGEIVFEPKYRDPSAIKGIEDFSHLWLIWGFSKSERENISLTSHPPRLGGKISKGVFITRSTFRPNPLAMSVVKIEEVIYEGSLAPRIIVSGIDMADGTPIYDIKPYLPYNDIVEEARGGYAEKHKYDTIAVDFPEELLNILPEDKRQAAVHTLEQDPRAAYNKKPDYIFGMEYAGFDIRFTATDDLITVKSVRLISDGLEKVK